MLFDCVLRVAGRWLTYNSYFFNTVSYVLVGDGCAAAVAVAVPPDGAGLDQHCYWARPPCVVKVVGDLLLVDSGNNAAAYSVPSRRTRLLRMQAASEPTPAVTSTTGEPVKEWQGAKKFSMKDRYTETVFTSEQISKILPHRYPFLLVDRVVEFIPGKSAVGIKSITANEPQFTGHFPDRPIMPGVLMIEAMAQLGGIICLSPPINEGKQGAIFFFTGVNGVRWKSPVTPGDHLIMEMNLVSFDERLGFATMTGKAYVGGRICVEVKEFTFALAK